MHERGPGDSAHQKAFDVVGLYGDPTVAWSIMVVAELPEPRDPALSRAGLGRLVAEWPHCGPEPEWDVIAHEQWSAHLERMATTLYTAQSPLVRGAATPDGRVVAVAAHHGVLDGLGLLALLSAALDVDLRSRVRGVADAPSRRPYLITAGVRVLEAVVTPPRRFRPSAGGGSEDGEWLMASALDRASDTSGLVAATCRALTEWGSAGAARQPVVISVGASRRPAAERLRPDRETALLRLVGRGLTDVEEVRRRLRGVAPEPDSPTTRAKGIGPLVTRLLAQRLGSTALVSNLGLVVGGDSISRLWFYPAVNGPCGVSVGAVTVGDVPTLTLRVRRRDFSESAARRLLTLLSDALRSPSQHQDQ